MWKSTIKSGEGVNLQEEQNGKNAYRFWGEKEPYDSWKKGQVVTGILFVVALVLYSLCMYRLFYLQSSHAFAEDIYMSDMKAYMQTMLGQESGFDFPYPIFFWLGEFFLHFTGVEVAAALATTVLNSLCVVLVFYYMQKYMQKYYDELRCGDWMGILTVVITFSLFFISMLFAPEGVYLPGMKHKYLGVFSPNPYHNATYMATRPFSVVAFFIFVRILDYYEEKSNYTEFGLFGLFLFLTTMTKPSFTLVFVSAAGLVMAFRIIKSVLYDKSWRNFLPSLRLGLFFLPTFCALLYQFGGVFGKNSLAGEEGGIGFGFASVWKVHMDNIPLAIVLALAFPGLLLLLNLKELKTNTLYRFTWFQLIVSLLEMLLLYEKGDRFVHMNFSWGYMHGIFFVFMASLILLIQNTLSGGQKWYLLVPEWLAYGWHVYCGIIYFLYIWSGQFYYCF